MTKQLLSIIEQGGYPDFTSLYEKAGYQVTTVKTVRKANSFIKKNDLDVVIAEFNFQTDFRDRTSSLESILAGIQHHQETRVIIFVDKKNEEKFVRVSSRFPIYKTLTFPIDVKILEQALID